MIPGNFHLTTSLFLIKRLNYLINYFFSRSSRNFGEDLEEPRSDKISSGNREEKKRSGTSGNKEQGTPCAIPSSDTQAEFTNFQHS
jgi:hypothetical protein